MLADELQVLGGVRLHHGERAALIVGERENRRPPGAALALVGELRHPGLHRVEELGARRGNEHRREPAVLALRHEVERDDLGGCVGAGEDRKVTGA